MIKFNSVPDIVCSLQVVESLTEACSVYCYTGLSLEGHNCSFQSQISVSVFFSQNCNNLIKNFPFLNLKFYNKKVVSKKLNHKGSVGFSPQYSSSILYI